MTPDRFFATREQWFEHELQSHRRVWRCHDGCQRNFGSRASFEDHQRHIHDIKLAHNQLDAFLDMHEVQSNLKADATCPLCFETMPIFPQLRRHLGRHQVQLALFALPFNIGEKGTEGDYEKEVDTVDERSSQEAGSSVGPGSEEDPHPILENGAYPYVNVSDHIHEEGDSWSTGGGMTFRDHVDLTGHTDIHPPVRAPYYCLWDGCYLQNLEYSREDELTLHVFRIHLDGQGKFQTAKSFVQSWYHSAPLSGSLEHRVASVEQTQPMPQYGQHRQELGPPPKNPEYDPRMSLQHSVSNESPGLAPSREAQLESRQVPAAPYSSAFPQDGRGLVRYFKSPTATSGQSIQMTSRSIDVATEYHNHLIGWASKLFTVLKLTTMLSYV